jgi:transmembrane sensor
MPKSIIDPVASPDELARLAWDWLRLLSSRNVSEDDLQNFRRWVQGSAAHQSAYNEAKAHWDILRPSTGALLRANPGMVAAYERKQRTRQINRRTFLGAAVATAAVAGVTVVYPPLGLWPSASEWDADYRTDAGEQRTLALAPQADVTLNTRTSIRRQMAGEQTAGLELLAGEAAVDLKGHGNPFVVVAGAGRSVAQTGQFEVRYLENKVCVTCIQGAVRIEHPAGTRVLQARQQAVYDVRTVSNIAEIDPADISAWRKGVLVFKEASLTDVVAEINRYRSGRVLLMRDDLRGKRVTGHFEIASLDRALTQLQYMFDLRARALVGGVLILS